MADCADIANAVIENNVSSRLACRVSYQQVSAFECEYCGEMIPEQRRKLGGVTRCMNCQVAFEQGLK
ncbi:TraR/DksA C4-type zinc finger protein [Acinetobacter sp. B5B]|uniref:TraR/DksA C4-type zinc finger protein n=1 Tax=Acinetobacter baretiae TaxID=2605383 RepID=UPI0018C2EF06|nr:TraR/DksA C4-type zinc finger protein [Acinetobacter baretiae]MBF7683940.1 TraR/DksA C4-type zinc finger protein [Acinetobacter baretiae]